MTRAQLDLQTQLENTPSDLTTQPLFNDYPIFFLESLVHVHAHASEQVEQTEHHTTTLKDQTPSDNSHETPPLSKKKYEIMKGPIFISLPIYPPILTSKPSLSTNRDDHLVPIDTLTTNAGSERNMTFLYMHPTDYTVRLYEKIEICLHPLPQR